MFEAGVGYGTVPGTPRAEVNPRAWENRARGAYGQRRACHTSVCTGNLSKQLYLKDFFRHRKARSGTALHGPSLRKMLTSARFWAVLCSAHQ